MPEIIENEFGSARMACLASAFSSLNVVLAAQSADGPCTFFGEEYNEDFYQRKDKLLKIL